MRLVISRLIACAFATIPVVVPRMLVAQAPAPLAPAAPNGQTVTPAFEGWYRNPDGTYSISFGYYNRNTTEVLSVPIGPDNFVSPGNPNQGQPAYFYPRRHWGVFAVKVPADFGDQKKVVWTIKIRGQDVLDPRQLARGMADRRARGRGGLEQHAARARLRRRRASGARAGGHHGRAIGDRRQAALDHRFCDGRWRRSRRALARRRSRHADLVHASGPGSGHVRPADFAAHADGRQGDDDGDLQPSRATTSFACARTTPTSRPRDTRSAAGPTHSSK